MFEYSQYWGPALLVAPFLVIFIGVAWYSLKRRKGLLAKNFAWYKAQNPNYVREGTVKCTGCEGTNTRVRGLMQRTFVREHFCGTCGKTLYYSPESNA